MRRIRCAIYTRKSSDEGLDQAFNSLDAQREACEAYVSSQRHEGWKLLKTRYDDGGLSGGTLDRPALKQILAEIDAGRIDMVVVYKIDRLTRSLMDFAKLVERLDQAGASFVSVTQQFNTSTSMGRLTLNVLLSFAQFEREVTAERIRDKIAASKKKGLWMGGLPPLGYDKTDTGLVINAAEAETVRTLFQAYTDMKCVRRLKAFAENNRLLTKRRIFASGRVQGGKPFSKGALYHLLSNPIYRGKIRHHGDTYDGQHDAIIDDALWDEVQAQLSVNRVSRNSRSNTKNPSPLAGKVFDEDGTPLTSEHAKKGARRYRYYCRRDGGLRVSALELERCATQAISESRDVSLAITGRGLVCAPSLDQIERLTLIDGRISIELLINDQPIKIEVPFTRQKRGVEHKLVLTPGDPRAPDQALIKRIAQAMSWLDLIKAGASIKEVAETSSVTPEYITHNLDLAFLSPSVQRAILEGRQSPDVSAYQLSKISIPPLWNDQTDLFLPN